MKITIKDLEKAIAWIKANSSDMILDIRTEDEKYMHILCTDKYQVDVKIKLFREGSMMPRMTKESQLP